MGIVATAGYATSSLGMKSCTGRGSGGSSGSATPIRAVTRAAPLPGRRVMVAVRPSEQPPQLSGALDQLKRHGASAVTLGPLEDEAVDRLTEDLLGARADDGILDLDGRGRLDAARQILFRGRAVYEPRLAGKVLRDLRTNIQSFFQSEFQSGKTVVPGTVPAQMVASIVPQIQNRHDVAVRRKFTRLEPWLANLLEDACFGCHATHGARLDPRGGRTAITCAGLRHRTS